MINPLSDVWSGRDAVEARPTTPKRLQKLPVVITARMESSVGSQAYWSLFQTQGGAFFEVSSDHDGAPNPIRPLTRADAKRWLQSYAPRLVEKYFGEAPEARARGASQMLGSATTDAEIRGRLLKHFYGLRNSNDGWVPTSEIILSPEQVSRQAIANVCQQLADAGLIEWKPYLPGPTIGLARIRGPCVDAVERGSSASLEIRFPNKAAAVASGQPAPQAAPASDDGISDVALAEIREAIAEIRSQLPAIVTSNATKAEIESDVAQIDTELERPTPRRKFLKTFLESLRDNLAKAAATGLVALVAAILAKSFHVF